MHLIMFDIDGTLLKSNTLDYHCFSGAFSSVMGIEKIESDWTSFKYVTDEGVISEILETHLDRAATKDEISNIRKKVLQLLRTQAHRNPGKFAPIPGALELFDSLKEIRNCGIAIATGCWKESAILKLSTAGFNVENFPIASSDDSHRRDEIMDLACKRALEFLGVDKFETITYFGDGVWDIKASKKLGYHFIGIGFYNNEKELREEGASYILNDYSDMAAIFAKMSEIWAS